MAKTSTKKQSSSKKSSSTKTNTNTKNPRFVICPYTDQKVFVARATLADLKAATSSAGGDGGRRQKRLWTISSAQIRQDHYGQVAQALAQIEQDILPSYGGRSWEVAVNLKETNGRVLFRSYRGKLELATLPHLIDRIPKPPVWPGTRCQPKDEYELMDGEEAEAMAKKKHFKSEQEYIQNLTTREVSTLSSVAYEVLRKPPHNYPVPTVSITFKSPDGKTFTSRKAAWNYAGDLSKKEVSINRNILGVGASGKLLQAFIPSLKTSLEVGKLRFERDGLWVVGQELAWQATRPEEWEAQQQQEEEAAAQKVYTSGLQLFLAANRLEYKEQHGTNLQTADKELRQQWRKLSPQEQQRWNDKVQDQFSASSDEEEEIGGNERSNDIGNASNANSEEEQEDIDQEEEEEVEYISNLQYFIQQRRHDYRYERQIELNVARFTLAQADRELRAQWRNMTEDERDKWIAKLEATAEKQEEEKDDTNMAKVKDDKDHVTKQVGKTEMEHDSEVSLLGEEKKEEDAQSQSSNIRNEEVDTVRSDVSVVVQQPSLSTVPTVGSNQVKIETTASSEPQVPCARVAQPTARATQRWCMKKDHIDLCHSACMEHYDTVMRTVKSRDLFRELADGFDVLRERGHGRFDMEIDAFDTPAFDFLTNFKKTPWMPVVRAILGDDVVLIHKGCFLSLPGAGAQVYHQDGVHLTTQTQRPCHAINVFVPLVDLHAKNGPTEFCLGSHVLGHEGYDRDFLETPKPSAGTPVIFDYRLGHRGLANSSHSCRPIVYCTYARAADGKEFRDLVNFSRKRYRKIGDLAAKPLSREERKKKRKRMIDSREEVDLKKALEISAVTNQKTQINESLITTTDDLKQPETNSEKDAMPPKTILNSKAMEEHSAPATLAPEKDFYSEKKVGLKSLAEYPSAACAASPLLTQFEAEGSG
jgi:hypothetical protein